MSITANLAAFQARHRAIAGVATAPDDYPFPLNDADLPCILTDIGEGVTRCEAHGDDEATEDRMYVVRGYCLPVSEGIPVEQGKKAAIALLDAVLADYRDDSDLTSTAFLRLDTRDGIRDMGVRSGMIYADVTYFGFEIRALVQERHG